MPAPNAASAPSVTGNSGRFRSTSCPISSKTATPERASSERAASEYHRARSAVATASAGASRAGSRKGGARLASAQEATPARRSEPSKGAMARRGQSIAARSLTPWRVQQARHARVLKVRRRAESRSRFRLRAAYKRRSWSSRSVNWHQLLRAARDGSRPRSPVRRGSSHRPQDAALVVSFRVETAKATKNGRASCTISCASASSFPGRASTGILAVCRTQRESRARSRAVVAEDGSGAGKVCAAVRAGPSLRHSLFLGSELDARAGHAGNLRATLRARARRLDVRRILRDGAELLPRREGGPRSGARLLFDIAHRMGLATPRPSQSA